MRRSLITSLAAMGLTLALASVSLAAPKASGSTCTAGIGKAVCCKAFVANHCSYVSCCEMGNQAFFTGSNCGACGTRAARAQCAGQKACSSSQACAADKAAANAYVSCCERGNGAFFKKSGCGDCAARKGSAATAACCAADKK